MPRYKLTIEYDGGPFCGWQRQANGPSVQQALEEAIAKFCGEAVGTTAAGRTDAGVHALGQVAHFDLDKDYTADKVRDAVNYHLKPAPVAIVAAEIVSDEFNARFSAFRRHYVYRILNRRAPAALDRGHVWRLAHALDADAMHGAAQAFVGKHDFTTFRAAECQANSPVKSVEKIDVSRQGEEIAVSVSAPSFLHHQVRSFVGTLERVGAGKWTAADVKAALEAKDRSRCGPVAPPDGLYLVRADYPAP